MFISRKLSKRWSDVAGMYLQNAFSIRLPVDTSIIDPDTLKIVQDDSNSLSVLVHEYWHYLQNLSTVAGFMSFALQQHFARAFSETLAVTGDGTSVGSDAIGGELPNQVQELSEILDAREGELTVAGIDVNDVSSFRITGVQEEDYTLTLDAQPVPLRKIVLEIEATLLDHSVQTGQMLFGQICVEEGIAYLLDRLVAGDAAAVGADNSPAFPYFVLRELALTGSAVDLTPFEIAALGTLSLLTPDPAGIFLSLRDDYAAARESGKSIADALDELWSSIRADVEGAVDLILRDALPSIVSMYRGRGLMESAAEWLAAQYATLLQRRLRDPFFDLRPFAQNRVDRKGLSSLIRTILPCDVIIERQGDRHAPERDTIVTFGMPGPVAGGYRVSDVLRVWEAQVDFVLSHLGIDRFESSDEVARYRATLVEEDVEPCPFYTSCSLELRRAQASTCFRSPWLIFQPDQSMNCWYGSAVASVLGTVSVRSVIRDAREIEQEHEQVVQAVRLRAHEIWEERGFEQNNAWSHWFQARNELGIPSDYSV